jgi:hypothetical protein
MTEAAVSFAGTLTDDPELRHTQAGITRAMFRVAVSGKREQEASFFTVIVWRDQAEHAAQSLRGCASRWSWAAAGAALPAVAGPRAADQAATDDPRRPRLLRERAARAGGATGAAD